MILGAAKVTQIEFFNCEDVEGWLPARPDPFFNCEDVEGWLPARPDPFFNRPRASRLIRRPTRVAAPGPPGRGAVT